MRMAETYGESGSLLYLEKHGIDFVGAQELWNDTNLPINSCKND
jgi:uncharacterized DUF497 family protein